MSTPRLEGRHYLRRKEIQLRLGLSEQSLYRLRAADDPALRFPAPTIVLVRTPLWALEVVEAYEQRQRERTARSQGEG